jgi:uncharacterized Fe-S radical SAM superfamily protein PflX
VIVCPIRKALNHQCLGLHQWNPKLILLEEKHYFRKMEAKKNGRMTIKVLSEEFEKEIKSLKGIVKLLEKRLDDSERKVEILEEKLGEKEEVVEHSLEIEIKCKVCEFKCESKQSLYLTLDSINK